MNKKNHTHQLTGWLCPQQTEALREDLSNVLHVCDPRGLVWSKFPMQVCYSTPEEKPSPPA